MSSPREASRCCHHGQLTTPGRLARRRWLLVAPGALWLALFLALPLIAIAALSFLGRGDYGEVEPRASLDAWRGVAGFGSVFGWSSTNTVILLRSLLLAAVSSALCLAIAYPLAFFIAARGPRVRWLLLGLVALPSCVNLLIRVYGWKLLLNANGPLALLAHAAGIVEDGGTALTGVVAVHVAMVATALPFAVLPLYAVVERLDRSLIEAARDLYAGPWRTFRHAVLPQTRAGLVAAAVLTLIPSFGTFLVPKLLGDRGMLVGEYIQQQFFDARDWPQGAAASMVLVALSIVALVALRREEG